MSNNVKSMTKPQSDDARAPALTRRMLARAGAFIAGVGALTMIGTRTKTAAAQDREINTVSVLSLEELADLTPSANRTAIVLGAAACGDGGDGIYWWDASSKETANKRTIVQSNLTSTGRWKRLPRRKVT